MQTVLVKQETEYQLIELCCSVSLFLVLWSNFNGMKTIRQEGVRLRGVQYKPNRMRGKGAGVDRGYQTIGVYLSRGVY